MKKVILLTSLFVGFASFARITHLNGYVKKNGTYVQPHFKTSADNIKLNNYSQKGNINPFSGKKGNKK